jgi:hypothetical protein
MCDYGVFGSNNSPRWRGDYGRWPDSAYDHPALTKTELAEKLDKARKKVKKLQKQIERLNG